MMLTLLFCTCKNKKIIYLLPIYDTTKQQSFLWHKQSSLHEINCTTKQTLHAENLINHATFSCKTSYVDAEEMTFANIYQRNMKTIPCTDTTLTMQRTGQLPGPERGICNCTFGDWAGLVGRGGDRDAHWVRLVGTRWTLLQPVLYCICQLKHTRQTR